jgi:hypothetical protein
VIQGRNHNRASNSPLMQVKDYICLSGTCWYLRYPFLDDQLWRSIWFAKRPYSVRRSCLRCLASTVLRIHTSSAASRGYGTDCCAGVNTIDHIATTKNRGVHQFPFQHEVSRINSEERGVSFRYGHPRASTDQSDQIHWAWTEGTNHLVACGTSGQHLETIQQVLSAPTI